MAVVIMSGTDVEALAAEVVAEPAPRADDLVGDQQDVVLVADLAHALPVAVLGHEAAARVLYRLEDHRRHGLRTLELDHLLDRVGRPERIALLGPAVAVGVRHVMGAGHERLEHGAQRGDAGDRESAEGGAVVGGFARDDLRLQRIAAELVVLARQLPGRLHRLGATGGEEHAVEVAGSERRRCARPTRWPPGARSSSW